MNDNTPQPTTFRERLAAVETDIKWIKDNIQGAKTMEKRVSRLERAMSYATGAVAVAGWYLKSLIK